MRRTAQILRAPEHQESARRERVLEERDRFLLQLRIEVDQDVAAGREVDLRIGRIARHVVRGEDAQLAHRLRDLPAARRGGEEFREALGRDAAYGTLRVCRGPCRLQRFLVRSEEHTSELQSLAYLV